jgi:hypothetical protein
MYKANKSLILKCIECNALNGQIIKQIIASSIGQFGMFQVMLWNELNGEGCDNRNDEVVVCER